MMETIGTRPEEDNSYNTVITLIVTFTIVIVLCSLLEMVGYFLYSMKVWRQIEKNNICHEIFLVSSYKTYCTGARGYIGP